MVFSSEFCFAAFGGIVFGMKTTPEKVKETHKTGSEPFLGVSLLRIIMHKHKPTTNTECANHGSPRDGALGLRQHAEQGKENSQMAMT